MNLKSPFRSLLIFYAIMLLSIQPSFQYIFTGNQVIDLNTTVPAAFIQDTTYWTASSLVSSSTLYYQCGSYYLLGGYNVLGTGRDNFFQRIYSGLSAHTMVRFSFTAFCLDTWDSPLDGFLVSFDSQLLDAWHMSYGLFTGGNVCGASSANDLAFLRVFGLVAHSASTLTFKAISDFDEPSNNESVGIRDINFIFDQGPAMPQTICGRAPINLPYKTCSCPEGQYYGSSGCTNCHSACASCYGGTAFDCYACTRPGYGFDGYQCVACAVGCDTCSGSGINQCFSCITGYTYFPAGKMCLYSIPYPLTTTTDVYGTTVVAPCSATNYVYWDKTCLATCPSPLVSGLLLNTVQLCLYPCSPNEYLYWDGTCHLTCPSPLTTTVTKSSKLCLYTCTIGQYLNADKTCTSTCALPLYVKTINSQLLCINPCTIPGDYLYWDQSCLNTCASPLGSPITAGVQYCTYSCSGSQYLYWNGSCLATCVFPLQVRVDKGQQFCDYPTSTTQFLYWDGTTDPTCSSGLTQRTEGTPVRKFCDFKCQVYEYLYANGTCSLNCNPPLTKRFQNGRQFCDNACTGGYLYWNSSCLVTCPTPLITRLEGSNKYCDFPIGNTNNFLYWDGTFSSACDIPLIQKIEGSPIVRKFCTFPCSSISQFLYWDGNCSATCPSPLTSHNQNSRNFCDFPCATNFKLYDGSCIPSCDPPLKQVVQGAGKLCNYPCSNTADFYYWNGSCQATCPLPYQQQTVKYVNLCVDPCLPHQYLYSNGICLDSCELPFAAVENGSMKYCVNSCPSSQYLFWDGSCVSSCNPPLQLNISGGMGNQCSLPCSSVHLFYHQATGQCNDECDSSSIVDNGQYLLCLAEVVQDTSSILDVIRKAPSDAQTTFVSFVKILQYVKYTNITFPPRLKRLSASKGKNVLSLRFGPEMSKSMKGLFIEYDLPQIFSQYELPSNFIVNFWPELITWLVLAVIAVFFNILGGVCYKRGWLRIQKVFTRLTVLTKWNFLLILISTSTNNIVLFASIQWRARHLDSSLSSLGFQFSLVMIGLIAVFISIASYVVSRWRKIQDTDQVHADTERKEFLADWNQSQIFFKGFDLTSRLTSSFYVIYTIRFFLPMLIAVFAYPTPLTQVLSYLTISVAMISYIFLLKPIKSTINYVQLMILEVIILVINFCLTILTFLSPVHEIHTFAAVLIGDIIIVGNSMVGILFVVVLCIKVVIGARDIYISQRDQSKKDRSAWLQLFVPLLQQAGMGFEEIELVEKEAEESSDDGMPVTKKCPDAKKRVYETLKNNFKRDIDDKESEVTNVESIKPIRSVEINRAFSQIRQNAEQEKGDVQEISSVQKGKPVTPSYTLKSKWTNLW